MSDRSNTTHYFVDVETDRLHVSAFIYKTIFRSGKGITEEELTMLPLIYNAHCPKATGKRTRSRL